MQAGERMPKGRETGYGCGEMGIDGDRWRPTWLKQNQVEGPESVWEIEPQKMVWVMICLLFLVEGTLLFVRVVLRDGRWG